MNDQPRTELTTVETPLDRRRVGDMKIEKFGGLTFSEYREAVEFAKIMCQARHTIPKFLKQNVGDCLAVITQSLRWNLEPFWIAQHSYVAKPNDPDSLIAYDSAVFSAIVESAGILKSRPRYTYAGEGEERTCTVAATFIGETEPHDYTTPPLKTCRPRRNEQGNVRGSPLWDKDPDQQLGYYAMRNFGRRHCAAVLGGIYDRDEYEEASQVDVIAPTSPDLMARLPGRMTEGQGFHPTNVANGQASKQERQEPAKQAANTMRAEQQAHKQEKVQEIVEGVATEQASDQAAKVNMASGAPTEAAEGASVPSGTQYPAGVAAAQAAAADAAKPRQTRKRAEPKPETTSEPTQVADSDVEIIEPTKPVDPTTPEGYIDYLRKWTSESKTAAYIHKTWSEEKDLRGRCGVVSDYFNTAKAIKEARAKELEA